MRDGPQRRTEVTAFLAVIAAVVTMAAVAFGYGWDSWVPAGAIAFGLIIVTNAAKLTVAVARIALPPIPASGETVSNDELLDPVATTDTSEESETWRAIIASVPDSATRLTERSQLARRLLIGFLTAAALTLSAGSIAVVVQGHFFTHSLIVAGLVTVVCGFRSRLYAERWCAWALMAAALAIPTGVTVRLCLWYPERAWLLLALYTALVLVAVILIGATDGIGRVSPSHQQTAGAVRRRRNRRGDRVAVVDRGRLRPTAQPEALELSEGNRHLRQELGMAPRRSDRPGVRIVAA